MTVLLVLFLLILIILIVRLFMVQEGFEDKALDPNLVKSYKQFTDFYNPFLVNWEKSIMTSLSLNSPPPAALTSPSQIGSGSSIITPSRTEMNTYITKLSKTLSKDLPPLTDPLPNTIDVNSFSIIQPLIPKDAKPYINALQWMNTNMSSSHSGLGSALQVDHFYNIEGFEDTMCPAVTQCIKQQQEQENNQFLEKQKQLQLALDKFNNMPQLTQLMDENHALVEESNKIKDQAQSGELFNKISVSNTPAVTYSNPQGANNLNDMKTSDPVKYQNYEKNYSHLFTLKQQLDQINANLR